MLLTSYTDFVQYKSIQLFLLSNIFREHLVLFFSLHTAGNKAVFNPYKTRKILLFKLSPERVTQRGITPPNFPCNSPNGYIRK